MTEEYLRITYNRSWATIRTGGLNLQDGVTVLTIKDGDV
jgi:hypothetical protein